MQDNQDNAAPRDPAETWNEPRRIDWLSRNPVVIVACGCPSTSGEQLIGLQMAVGRLIAWVAGLRLPRFGQPSRSGAVAAPTIFVNR